MFSFEMRLHKRVFTITHKDKVALLVVVIY